MFVSIIIATRNRSALLSQTLDALAEQRWPVDRLEIIVAAPSTVPRMRWPKYSRARTA